MRSAIGVFSLMTCIGCTLVAQPAPAEKPTIPPAAAPAPASPAANTPLTNDSSVDVILDALDARGRNLQAFTADVSLTEGDAALANEVTRRGKVLFQDQSGKARLRVIFTERDTGKRVFPDKIEYLLQDGWLTDRTYGDKRIEVRRQVLRPGQKLDLLKLGEGPFPLPIGQKKESVHEQFNVKKLPPAKIDPPNTIRIQLAPKPGTRLERKFEAIDVWVDVKTHMPVRIDTIQGETVRTTELKNFIVNPNPPLADKDFALEDIDRNTWSFHEEPFSE